MRVLEYARPSPREEGQASGPDGTAAADRNEVGSLRSRFADFSDPENSAGPAVSQRGSPGADGASAGSISAVQAA